MQEYVDFNGLLHRQIADGKKFKNLFPKSNCAKTALGTGDTSYSIKQMEEMVKEYSYQVEKVALLLQTSSLNSTLENVKDFIYSHFQYKADQDDQLLRSPACSWYDRYNGIDCKSYSILASSLLLKMNPPIKHYIRRIKQPSYAPTEWTHVYVVVPLDQQSGTLKRSYYTVDGTLEYKNEPTFVEKDDLFMSLPHYKLNAPANQSMNGINDISLNDLFNAGTLLSNFNSIFSGFWQKVRCTTFLGFNNHMVNNSDFERVKPEIANFFENLLKQINQQAHDGKMVDLEKSINQYLGLTNIAKQCYYYRTGDGFDVCTRAGLYAFEFICFNYEFIGEALKIWMTNNYNVTSKGSVSNYNKISLNGNIFEYSNCGANPAVLVNDLRLSEKGTDIKAFVVTDYLKSTLPPFYSSDEILNVSKYKIDKTTFINSLDKPIVSFEDSTNNSSNTTNNSPKGNPTQNNIGNVNEPPPQQAGFGIMGWVIGGIAFTMLVKKFTNDKPATSSKRKTNVTARK